MCGNIGMCAKCPSIDDLEQDFSLGQGDILKQEVREYTIQIIECWSGVLKECKESKPERPKVNPAMLHQQRRAHKYVLKIKGKSEDSLIDKSCAVTSAYDDEQQTKFHNMVQRM